jgi:UDP:flavonoid glycosyltransferase YjiC (YdhE family)
VLQNERMRGAALATAKAIGRERGAARSAELIESALRA